MIASPFLDPFLLKADILCSGMKLKYSPSNPIFYSKNSIT